MPSGHTASTSPPPAGAAAQPDQVIEAKLLCAASERKPLNLWMTVATTVLLGLLLWSFFPSALMTFWLIAISAATAVGFVECAARVRAAPGPEAQLLWQRVFAAQSLLAGLAWASGPTLMIRAGAGAESALLISILSGVCAVAMISVSAQRTAMQCFIAAVLLPPALAFWLTGGSMERVVAIALACGVVLMLLVGSRFNQSLRELIAGEYRMRCVVDTALDAVIGMDDQGRITDWNPRAQAVFGWSADEVGGRTLSDTIVPQRQREAHRSGLKRFLETGTGPMLSRRMEVTALRRNGEEFALELAITPLRAGDSWHFTAFMEDITDAKRAAAALVESEERFRTMIERSREAIAVHRAGVLVYVNPAAVKMFGAASKQALIGQPLLQFVHPDFHDIALARVRRMTAYLVSLPMIEEKFLKLDSSIMDVEVQSSWITYDGEPAIQVAMRDITKVKQTNEALRIAATAFESQEGIFITDAAKVIVRVNRSFSEITGYSATEAIGQTQDFLRSSRQDAGFYAAIRESLEGKGHWSGEVWTRRKDGEDCPVWLTVSAVKDEAGAVSNYVAAFTDITFRKAAEEEINSLAFYDPLTRLPNRRLLLDRLKQALASSARNRRYAALLLIDLDNFKTLNDTLGHDIGDLLLQQVAQRLPGCVREGDTVARLGGDEFVVILEDLSESEQEAATKAETVGEKILAALNQPYQLARYAHHNTPSIGVTLFADQRETIDDLLKRSDLAMYQVKAAGRNALRFFDPQMQAVVSARVALEADLREAIEQAQFVIHYQAQVVGDGRLTGAEALIRWQHPLRGLVSPLEFIPLAEETGLILPLGNWVLKQACAQLALWDKLPAMAQLTLAVNVSARQFHHRDFVDQVLGALESSGARPERLKLELTESLLVEDVEGVIAKMTALKIKGVGFSLDDFGTGYSSLYYLKRLPLDQLKIDQSFVRNILTNPNDAAIAKMVVALAESLGLSVIAEGVEMEAQRDFLARQGCHAYQGYFFSRPLPLAAFEAFAERA